MYISLTLSAGTLPGTAHTARIRMRFGPPNAAVALMPPEAPPAQMSKQVNGPPAKLKLNDSDVPRQPPVSRCHQGDSDAWLVWRSITPAIPLSWSITTGAIAEAIKVFAPVFELHADVRFGVPATPQSVQDRLIPPA